RRILGRVAQAPQRLHDGHPGLEQRVELAAEQDQVEQADRVAAQPAAQGAADVARGGAGREDVDGERPAAERVARGGGGRGGRPPASPRRQPRRARPTSRAASPAARMSTGITPLLNSWLATASAEAASTRPVTISPRWLRPR